MRSYERANGESGNLTKKPNKVEFPSVENFGAWSLVPLMNSEAAVINYIVSFTED